jgi:hypothetical protein
VAVGTGVEIRITGAEKLDALGAELKRQGLGAVRLKMLRNLRAAAKPVIDDVRHEIDSELPHGGGLNEFAAAAKLGVRTRVGGRLVGVRISGPRKGPGADLGRANDSGEVRHPVYGDRRVWAVTKVRAGFADRGLEKAAPAVRESLVAVLEETSAEIAAIGAE